MVCDVKWRPSLQQAASRDSYLFGGPTQMVSQLLFDGMYDLLSFDHDAKHYVLAVQARRGPGRYEKLTSVRVWTCAADRKKCHLTTVCVERQLITMFLGDNYLSHKSFRGMRCKGQGKVD
ncbi:unnamed protein product [Macrosiphum euphorbiae]|uniref:Uncharacterized protein n=1 Tax=Macrosiphum euphorbiae TaxID=13131 RepID=A0AAV0WUC2_9HEMI|nr:unnamed protein product [Macrosiphum euphorbiae]